MTAALTPLLPNGYPMFSFTHCPVNPTIQLVMRIVQLESSIVQGTGSVASKSKLPEKEVEIILEFINSATFNGSILSNIYKMVNYISSVFINICTVKSLQSN